jgi:hypothetical protein
LHRKRDTFHVNATDIDVSDAVDELISGRQVDARGRSAADEPPIDDPLPW